MNPLDDLQLHLFEQLVQPVVFGLGLGNLLEDAFAGTAWLVWGGVQLVLIATVLRLLEAWRPVEAVRDRAAIRADVLYTLLHKLGLFRLAIFFTVEAWAFDLAAVVRGWGWQPWQVDALWPGVTDVAVVSWVLYLLLFDAFDYAWHRGQHAVDRWWQLHAVHHSQQQMTCWSDDRNHLLDDVARDIALVLLAQAIGVAPGQFVAVVVVTQLMQSLSHANVRLDFGPVLGRLLVSPAYHRRHHAIGLGHESAGPGSLGGCNFAVLFPVWDLLFRTADFSSPLQPTGIRDQLPAHGGRDYGQGFWQQQRLGLRRLLARRPHHPETLAS
jgi:sterol desaturase/sphingolipid hydroxylase (fatty acid hydroxylase superfamily)